MTKVEISAAGKGLSLVLPLESPLQLRVKRLASILGRAELRPATSQSGIEFTVCG